MIQFSHVLRRSPILAALVLAAPALLLVSPAWAQTKGMAHSSTAPADAARPYSYVFLDPLEGQHSAAVQNSGNHVGVEMHGHWVIDVKNPDGTVAEHRDFENTASGYGQELLAVLMSGYAVPSDYAIFLASTGTAPCSAPQGNIGCGIVRSLTTLPGSALCQYYTCFSTETYAANIVDTSQTGSTFTLQGNFTATQAGTITGVSTLYGTCPANLSTVTALTTVSPSTCSTTPGSGGYRTGTTASITTVNVVQSQIVQVTVTFSFS